MEDDRFQSQLLQLTVEHVGDDERALVMEVPSDSHHQQQRHVVLRLPSSLSAVGMIRLRCAMMFS